MARQVCLLDFDGVCNKHKLGQEAVSKRCQYYVKRHTRINDMKKVKELNRNLYESTGHTVLGLQKLGYLVDMDDFNHFVYDYIDYSIFDDIHIENKKDIETLKKIQKVCDDKDITLCIFSAAPRKWCETVLSIMGEEDLRDIHILSDTISGLLKPDRRCYDIIENQFKGMDINFVDDKLINLLPVHGNSKWTNYLLCELAGLDEVKHVKGNLHMLSDLSSLIVDDDLLFHRYNDSLTYIGKY
jgi:FMN phosphatase YigB (HAD superfamily)